MKQVLCARPTPIGRGSLPLSSVTSALRKGTIGLCVLLGALSGLGCADQATRVDRSPFTIVMVPDTQHYSRKWPASFVAQTDWIKENVQRENIRFVTHVGDIVNDRNKRMDEWEVADRAMSTLDGVVPWGVALGNHDYDARSERKVATGFLEHFGPQRFANCAWYGASPNGLNSFQLFSGGGIDFLVLHLEMEVPDDAIAWAAGILDRYPRRVAILTTHSYLYGRNNIGRSVPDAKQKAWINSGEQIWDKLVRGHPQIVMVLCGHVQNTVEYHQVSQNDAGGKVLEILADYQKRHNGGDGWLRLLRVVPAQGEVQVRTYSPVLGQFETDANSQYVLPLELPAGVCAAAGAGHR